MIASRLTAQRLLNRLPPPRRATLQDVGHAAALLARASLATQPHDVVLAERLEALEAWVADAVEHYARPDRRKAA